MPSRPQDHDLGAPVREREAANHAPLVAVFASAGTMAVAVSHLAYGPPFTLRALQWFVSFSLVMLAAQKLRDVERFSARFMEYDLLARRWAPYAKFYPFLQFLAGGCMAAGIFPGFSAPVSLLSGAIGAESVIKAVWIDRRGLQSASVGGDSNMPLGFGSLFEAMMMVAIGAWIALEPSMR
jgi:hypothetical protein